MDSIYPVLSGALAQEKRLEVITNNLANINTSGFKKDIALFEGINGEQRDPTIKHGLGPSSPSAMFSKINQIHTDFTPGPIRMTGEPLDVAISGEGFFAVQTPVGTRYTRNGHFTLNAEREIVTQGGFQVLGSGGPISIPNGTIMIDAEGRVSVKDSEIIGGSPVEVDLLPVFRFENSDALQKVGSTLFDAGRAQATPSTEARIRQGALEGSNVNSIEEMVAMISVSRRYEAAQKAMQTADEITGKAANEVGRLA
ncbi:MAG: flagellar basal-body rod protein FlgF [Nitrospiria bacterium]